METWKLILFAAFLLVGAGIILLKLREYFLLGWGDGVLVWWHPIRAGLSFAGSMAIVAAFYWAWDASTTRAVVFLLSGLTGAMLVLLAYLAGHLIGRGHRARHGTTLP